MKRTIACLLAFAYALTAQITNSEILGTVHDASGAVVGQAKITIKNTETGISREAESSAEGKFRVPQLQPGSYTISVTKSGFGTLTQGPIILRLNQAAEFNLKLQVAGVAETINVTADTPLINTTNSEVGQNFEAKRIAELPLAPNRNMLNLALNVAGVSQISSGQSDFASGISFSANGMRVRSNNFMLDGQDINDPSVTGSGQQFNNPEVIQEVRVITNQFAAEYGRSAGSAVSMITKSGTNEFHGSGYWFHNSNTFNSRSNLDKNARLQRTPFRNENFAGMTLGGPAIKNKTFFFGSAQRWWDRQLGSGSSINGAPTAEGKTALQPFAARSAPLRALLEFLPAGNATAGIAPQTFTADGRTISVPLGSLTGTAPNLINNTQWLVRADHNLSDAHRLTFRYNSGDNQQISGQATPTGLTSNAFSLPKAATAAWNWTVNSNTYTELRTSYARQETGTVAADPRSELIPSIEVNSLGLTGFNAANSRTAIGLAVNLPQARANNTYQLQYTVGHIRGNHTYKAGIDFREQHIKSLFLPTLRGRLAYETLQDVVDDRAQTSQINAALRGGATFYYNRFKDYMFFVQDEWRVTPNFTLNYGIRYESPGNPFLDLQRLNDSIVAANNNDPRYKMDKAPPRDNNNWAPRIGFNYRLDGGIFGQGKTVLRGGYARTYDFAFINIGLNMFSAFPFLNSVTLAPRTANSMPTLLLAGQTPITAPDTLVRTIVDSSLRSPFAEQFSVNMQRQLGNDWSFTAGWVATKGSALFQTVDGNPTTGPSASGALVRVNPARGVIRLRANTASSIYHSLQLSAEKRYSKGYNLGAHYTWSSFIDDASEIFNPAVNGDVAVSQDSFNRRNDRGRSTYDRPMRLTLTMVYDVPKDGFMNRLLPGMQFNAFWTAQSGAPFTPLNGTDPLRRLSGIDGLVGNAIRPNVATNLDISSQTLNDLYPIRTSLFQVMTAQNTTTGLGNAGRNTLRADGIGNLDLGVSRNMEILPDGRLKAQIRADMFNITNTRNFGIPESRANSANFLNQWGQDGGRRRIQMALRFIF
ncbi:MAG: hypothetical protein FJW32_05315 [Acidobacteria bacterium]|nr:hypothetical protein [Acidobacteriota bacterium]